MSKDEEKKDFKSFADLLKAKTGKDPAPDEPKQDEGPGWTLETGDEVKVLTRNGKPYAISKVEEAWLTDVDMPDLAETETIKGRVTDVDGDTIKIKDDNGVVHTADITGFQNMQELEVETIEEGDIIVVNVRDGKTYGISKHTEAWLVN